MYDYLIVGSGLYGSVFAYEANRRGYKCLVVEKRKECGGNIYCENKDGINIHKYGAHIFHTSNVNIWNYVNQFADFNGYIASVIANYKGEIYNLPFNMNTFNKMWGVITPREAFEKINEQRSIIKSKPTNLEDQAISLVGTDIYEKLIKGYVEKQWGRKGTDLPAFIIQRLPVRYTYDNNYYNDRYQGIPIGGYNIIINNLLKGIEVHNEVDFNENRKDLEKISKKIVYTGLIDSYFNYKLGQLEYRGLKFKTERLMMENYQGTAVVSYTEREIPYTRIIEHKHFESVQNKITYITKEYPSEWEKGQEAYYPINDDKNQKLYNQYVKLAEKAPKTHFGGRLGEYKYYDMDKVIESALKFVWKEFNE